MSELSKNIERLRKNKKMTQEELADDLGIGRARLGSYEEGRSEPPIKLLMAIASYFNVTVDQLLS